MSCDERRPVAGGSSTRARAKDALEAGDRAIRARLAELAASRHVTHDGIVCRLSDTRHDHGRFVLAVREYSLAGTSRSVAFRAQDVQLAAEPETMRRYIEPRLEAVFEDIWWRKSVILLAARGRDGDDGTS